MPPAYRSAISARSNATMATPSLGSLAQIARGLDIGMDYFIATPSMEDGLTRAGERKRFSIDSSSIIYEPSRRWRRQWF